MIAVSAETMRELDRLAQANGISTLSLMENAGESIYKKASELLADLKEKRVAVFCGKGNNGGDGFVAARKLLKNGFDVCVYFMGRQNEVKNEAAINLKAFTEIKGKVYKIESAANVEKLKNKLNCRLIIDGLLGTGFSDSISGLLKKLIEFINSTGIPILAIDAPSGLNSTTGEINPVAIRATWTVSFALPKKGFYEKSGPEHTGELQVVNIGFPDKLLKKAIEYEEKACITSM